MASVSLTPLHLQALYDLDRQQRDSMVRRIASRIVAAEPVGVITTQTVLYRLSRPRWEHGQLCEFVVRQYWLRRRPRQHGVGFYYFATQAEALAAWPRAKVWP